MKINNDLAHAVIHMLSYVSYSH